MGFHFATRALTRTSAAVLTFSVSESELNSSVVDKDISIKNIASEWSHDFDLHSDSGWLRACTAVALNYGAH